MTVSPVQRPVVLYDGKCGFCKRHIARWSALSGDAIEYLPYQEHLQRFPQVTEQQLERAVHLIEPDGRIRRGANAVFRIAALSGSPQWLWFYEGLFRFRLIAEMGYALVASSRNVIDPID